MKNILNIMMIVIAAMAVSCKDQDDVSKEYAVANGTTYPGKPIGAVCLSGKNRVEVVWKRGADATVDYARVYWNNYSDSAQIDVADNADTVRFLIESMNEGDYAFNIRQFNKKGEASVSVEVMGKVYGNSYISSLVNRRPRMVSLDEATHSITIVWVGKLDNEVQCAVSYTNQQDMPQIVYVPADAESTIVPNFKQGLRIVSYFVPAQSIDTLYTEASKVSHYLKFSHRVNYALGTQIQAATHLTRIDHTNPTYTEFNIFGTDPYIYTAAIGEVLNKSENCKVYFNMEYQTNRVINNAQLFFCKPNAAGGVSTTESLHFDDTGLDPLDESKWHVFRYDLATAFSVHGWGTAATHRFRYDMVGNSSAKCMVYIRNLWFDVYSEEINAEL